MRYHRFAYSTALRDGVPPLPFRTRDGAAFGELGAVLAGMGWEYGSLIYNYPNLGGAALGPEHFRAFGAGDWLVLTTRPPLDDETHGDKRTIPRSHSHLEDAIFAEIKPDLLNVCARSHVRISESVAGPGLEEGNFEFRQKEDARLVAFNGLGHHKRATQVPENEYRTVGFFIKREQVRGYGCGLIACFSMGGIETLVWNRVVRDRFPQWMRGGSTFVVAELDLGRASVPDQTDGDRLVLPPGLVTLDFVKLVDVREIVNKPLE